MSRELSAEKGKSKLTERKEVKSYLNALFVV